MTKFLLVVNTTKGTAETEINLPDETAIITGFEILIDDTPVILMPLYVHEDSRRYHTLCSRKTFKITELEF